MTNWKRQSFTNKVPKIFSNIFRKLLHTNCSIVKNDISIKFSLALRYQFVFPSKFIIAKEDVINYILRFLWNSGRIKLSKKRKWKWKSENRQKWIYRAFLFWSSCAPLKHRKSDIAITRYLNRWNFVLKIVIN